MRGNVFNLNVALTILLCCYSLDPSHGRKVVCFNLTKGSRLGYARLGELITGDTVEGEPSQQIVYVKCSNSDTYTPYLETSYLSSASYLDGITQVCVLYIGEGEELDTPPIITEDSWEYNGQLIPRVSRSQWIVEFSCTKRPFYKDIVNLKLKMAANKTLHFPEDRKDKWWKGVYWDSKAELVSVRKRPLLMDMKGEVFWGTNYPSCPHCDLTNYRAKTLPSSHCLNMHFVNGIAHFSTRKRNSVFDLVAKMPQRTEATSGPEKEEAKAVAKTELDSKSNFCAFVSNECYKNMYHGEALLRSLFFDMIGRQYKLCHGLGGCRHTPGKSCQPQDFGNSIPSDYCGQTDLVTECNRDYKFVITMDNQVEEGYLTEKVYNAFFAPAIPIYFGAPDVAEYLNIDALVLCNVSATKIQDMRRFWKENHIKYKARKNPPEFKEKDAMQYLLDHGFEADLQPCVDRVIQLDQSDDLYTDMLTRPILPPSYHNSIADTHYDGAVISKAFLEVLKVLDSSLLDKGTTVATSDSQPQKDRDPVEEKAEEDEMDKILAVDATFDANPTAGGDPGEDGTMKVSMSTTGTASIESETATVLNERPESEANWEKVEEDELDRILAIDEKGAIVPAEASAVVDAKAAATESVPRMAETGPSEAAEPQSEEEVNKMLQENSREEKRVSREPKDGDDDETDKMNPLEQVHDSLLKVHLKRKENSQVYEQDIDISAAEENDSQANSQTILPSLRNRDRRSLRDRTYSVRPSNADFGEEV